MTAPVVGMALLFWVCVFMIYFTSVSTTPVEFFLGRFAPPPANLGRWMDCGTDAASGQLREERWLLLEGRPRAGYLLHQVRYRDAMTGQIVRIEPERCVRRKRVSSRP